MKSFFNVDVAIAGAGIIGLSVALELHARGATVAIFDPAGATRGASTSAAGMLAADDPHNPSALHAFSAYSASLYDSYLRRLNALSGMEVSYQTDRTVQYLDDGSTQTLTEHSIDPRELSAAALKAVRNSDILLSENCAPIDIQDHGNVTVRAATGIEVHARHLVHASGAWFVPQLPSAHMQPGAPVVFPRKGQMLRVRLPPGLDLREVHRSATLYIVPRTRGAQAGTAVIGATEEDAGFDLSVHQPDLDKLRQAAANLVPEFADAGTSPQVEAWAGLRPGTRDLLPLIGGLPASPHWAATGHYRNGILLAPGTAALLADLIEGRQPAIHLDAFSPSRFFTS